MATQFSEVEGRRWKAPFFTIWTGQALSLIGSQLVQFALIWYLTSLTGSAKVLAIAALVGLLPQVIFGPIIGSYVDRLNRRVIMIVADTFIAMATVGLAILFATNQIEIWHIYTLMFVRSLAGGFHHNAMTASTSLMVPTEQMTRIQGINQTMQGGLNIISAPLGALLLEVLEMQTILAIDVGTALFAIIPLLFISIPQPARIESGESKHTSVWEDTKAGFSYVMSWPGLLIMLAMATMINFLLNPASALMPLLVTKHFGGGALQLGWLEASFGIGVIMGGITLGIWGGFKRRVATAMFGVTGLGLGFLVFGFTPPSGFNLVLGAAIFSGIMIPIANGAIGAILQTTVSPDMQGRVFTLVGSVAMGMSPIGLIIAGPVADTFGILTWYWLGGAVCTLFGISGFFIPTLMNIEEEKKAVLETSSDEKKELLAAAD